MFHIFPKEFEIDIQNRKGNYLDRKWNYFSPFQKTTFKKFCHFHQGVQNWFSHFPSTKYVQCPLDIKKVSSSLAVRLIKSRKRHKFGISLRRKFENSNLLAEDFPLFPCLVSPPKVFTPSTKYVQCPPDMEKVSSSLAVLLIKSRRKA